MPIWLVALLFDAMAALSYLSISRPKRMYRGRFRYAYLPDRGYLAGVCLAIGLTPAGLWVLVTGDERGTVTVVLACWAVLCGAYGFLGLAANLPIPKWFVPPAYKNATEHVYPRRVIGLRKVDRLSDRPDAVAQALLPLS